MRRAIRAGGTCAFLALALSIAGLGGCSPASTDEVASGGFGGGPAESEAGNTELDIPWIKAGVYEVGRELLEGEYLVFSITGISASILVSKDESGAADSMIASDRFIGSRYQRVFEGEYIELRNAAMLPAGEIGQLLPRKGEYVQGMYKVGRDLPAGEYKIRPKGKAAYYSLNRDSRNTPESVITADNFSSEKIISVEEGQYLLLYDCSIVVQRHP